MKLAPLSSIQATIMSIVTAVVGLAVGMGAFSSTEGHVIVSAAGVILGAVISVANSVIALAHGKVVAAQIAANK